MKIEIEIPDFKFKKGDFIKYDETPTLVNLLVIARVEFGLVEGGWFCRLGENPKREVDKAYYRLSIQEGSLTTEGTPIRPGTLIDCLISEAHEYAELFDYQGKVWEGDTIHNIGDRM